MAVFTPLEEETVEQLLQGYALGELLSFHGIVEGVENSNFHLQTTTGRYILTLFEKRTAGEDLPWFVGLMEHLAHKGIACPAPIRGINGEALPTVQGKKALIVSFLDGVSHRKPLPEHCESLGATLARLHLAAADYPAHRANSMGWQHWATLAARLPDIPETLIPDSATLTGETLDTIRQGWPSTLPAGVIHADAFPDNVFFRHNNVSGIIDFYFACNDLLAFELAICLNAWCFERDGSFNATKASRLLRSYHRVRPLSKDEQQALPLLARGAALRFLLSRLEDWLAPKNDDTIVVRKDPREYAQKLRFARNIKHLGDWGVELDR